MSGRLGDFVARFLENLGGAVTAATATRADPKSTGQLFERARAALRAFAHLAFGYRVAEADIHAGLSKMLLIPISFQRLRPINNKMLAFTYVMNIKTMTVKEASFVDNNNENNYRYCQPRYENRIETAA